MFFFAFTHEEGSQLGYVGRFFRNDDELAFEDVCLQREVCLMCLVVGCNLLVRHFSVELGIDQSFNEAVDKQSLPIVKDPALNDKIMVSCSRSQAKTVDSHTYQKLHEHLKNRMK